MKKRKLYKIFIFAINFLMVLEGQSQGNFAYKGVLGEVKETKFYTIDLPPQVVAQCRPGLEDIRIFDDDNKQVPYILKNDLPVFKKDELTEFPVIKNAEEGDKQTHIILQNTSNKSVNNLLLFVRNTDASRVFSISGSDDQVHWFIIREKIYLDNSFNSDHENIIQTLSLPPANYKYFQLTILGRDILPFKIVKAGMYNEDITYGRYINITEPSISQVDSSDKKSYIFLKFDDNYQVNKLTLNISGAKYFRRKIIIRGDKFENDLLINDYINSDSTNSFIIDKKKNQLLIIIDNEDNIPLKVLSVKAFQLTIYLLTYLQSGKKYLISFGDSTVEAPKYDLGFFSDSIDKDPSKILFGNMERNNISQTGKPVSSKNNQLMLWIIIVTSLLILSFLTFKLSREVAKKSTD